MASTMIVSSRPPPMSICRFSDSAALLDARVPGTALSVSGTALRASFAFFVPQ